IRRRADLQRERGNQWSAADGSEQEGANGKARLATQKWDGDDLAAERPIAMNGQHRPLTERADHLQRGEKVASHVDDPELRTARPLHELSNSLALSLVGNDRQFLSGHPAEEASGELPVPDVGRQEDYAFSSCSRFLDEVDPLLGVPECA